MTSHHSRSPRQYVITGIQPPSLILSICVLISSCCTPGVKPEDANLFQAMCGLSTGDFEDQLEQDQSQVASSRQTLEVEKSRSDALNSDLERSKTELKNLLAELDQMEKENQRMEARISAMRTDTAEAELQQARLREKLETIQNQLSALKQKAAREQDAFDQYSAEKTRLKQEIEVLRMIIASQ